MLEDFRLRVFVTVASEGSFTKAAYKLDVTQPAVSQNIAELEKSLGVSLFKREGTRISITPEGSALLVCAGQILDGYSTMEALVSGFRTLQDTEEVLLSTDLASLPFTSGRVVPFMLSVNPEIKVSVSLLGSVPQDITSVPDLTITQKDGRTVLSPSRSFFANPLYKLVCNLSGQN